MLAALVILAVGLLALEALGIAAARSVARADRRSELTVGATGAMEAAIGALGAAPEDPAVAEGCRTDGVHACTRVETRATGAALPPGTARITVTARRTAEDGETLVVSSHVYHPLLP